MAEPNKVVPTPIGPNVGQYNDAMAYNNADLRLNETGVDDLLDLIKLHLIEDSQKQIGEGTTIIASSMDSYWTGAGAEAFKQYMDDKTKELKKTLSELRQEVERRIYAAAGASGQADLDAAAHFQSLGGNE